jgi:recombination protein U
LIPLEIFVLYTQSEKLVNKSIKEYSNKNIALIKKINPIKTISRHGVYYKSAGLDYLGVLKGGKFISFEVKETQKNYLPLENIRQTQIEIINRLDKYDAEVFLLVYFINSKHKWYLLYGKELINIIKLNPLSIPIRYFKAFGFIVPNMNRCKYPDFLNPERIAFHNEFQKEYPSWIDIRKDN